MVDEKVLLAASFAGEFGFGDIACDVGYVGLLVDGAEPFAVAVAEELADAFGEVACTEVVEQASVAGEGVVDVVVGEGYTLEDFLAAMEVPQGQAQGLCSLTWLPSMRTRVPSSLS